MMHAYLKQVCSEVDSIFILGSSNKNCDIVKTGGWVIDANDRYLCEGSYERKLSSWKFKLLDPTK